jgi:HEAT repeat protein
MDISPEHIKQNLHSENLGHRLKAINQLREIEPAIAFELIQTVLQDKSARVRYAAISQLAELGRQDHVRALACLREALLSDPEADVQAAAADSIAALHLVEAYDDLAVVYRQTSEWLLQMSIVACLGELGEPRAFELLQEALQSDTSLVVLSAIGALGEMGDARALPLLLPYTSHDDWQIRQRLAQALGNYSQPEAQAALAKLADDPSSIVAGVARAHL